MSTKEEILYYVSTIFLSCFLGAATGELYDANKDEKERAINTKLIMSGGTTGSVLLIGINKLNGAPLHTILVTGFLVGLFGLKILDSLKGPKGPRIIYLLFTEGIKSCIDYLIEGDDEDKTEDE